MNKDLIVYIIDDDDAIRDSMEMLMRSVALTAETYPSAQAFLDTHDPMKAGCLLVDVRMPGMSGLELQQLLAEQGNRLPVIIMTGHGDIDMAVQAMKAGAVDFIEKPFDAEALLASINACLQRRTEAKGIQAQAQRLAQLTQREREVFECLADGKPNKMIGADLDISARTVEVHRARIMEKLGAKSLADIVRISLLATPCRDKG